MSLSQLLFKMRIARLARYIPYGNADSVHVTFLCVISRSILHTFLTLLLLYSTGWIQGFSSISPWSYIAYGLDFFLPFLFSGRVILLQQSFASRVVKYSISFKKLWYLPYLKKREIRSTTITIKKTMYLKDPTWNLSDLVQNASYRLTFMRCFDDVTKNNM